MKKQDTIISGWGEIADFLGVETSTLRRYWKDGVIDLTIVVIGRGQIREVSRPFSTAEYLVRWATGGGVKRPIDKPRELHLASSGLPWVMKPGQDSPQPGVPVEEDSEDVND